MTPQLLGWLVIAVVFVAVTFFSLGVQYAVDRIMRGVTDAKTQWRFI